MEIYMVDDFGRPLRAFAGYVYVFNPILEEWWIDYPMSSQLLWDKLPVDRWTVEYQDFLKAFEKRYKHAVYDPLDSLPRPRNSLSPRKPG